MVHSVAATRDIGDVQRQLAEGEAAQILGIGPHLKQVVTWIANVEINGNTVSTGRVAVAYLYGKIGNMAVLHGTIGCLKFCFGTAIWMIVDTDPNNVHLIAAGLIVRYVQW